MHCCGIGVRGKGSRPGGVVHCCGIGVRGTGSRPCRRCSALLWYRCKGNRK